ncbi:hypothetical protein SAMN05444162_0927 [Paenibacillaceae bacterium GAS479]|nr:hypothetical protein SAMN05444162_0927 [Paenibacillaceae bacterium GAS479]
MESIINRTTPHEGTLIHEHTPPRRKNSNPEPAAVLRRTRPDLFLEQAT